MSDWKTKPIKASVVSKAAFDATFGEDNSLESEARQIISNATSVAMELQVAIEREKKKTEAYLTQITNDELRKFIDRKIVKDGSRAILQVQEDVASIRKEYQEITSWLIPLVEDCVQKILGSYESHDLVAQVVKNAAREFDQRINLVLLAHPESRPLLEKALGAYPDSFAEIDEIRFDPSLENDQLLLENKGGFLNIGIPAQLGVFLRNLERLASDGLKS